MRVAVVTAYYKEPTSLIRRCHESVINQTYGDVTHILVSDGFPNADIDGWDRTIHIKLTPSRDYGDTPRFVGGIIASSHNFDAVLMLDADNFFDLNHVETMIAAQAQTDCEIITATRRIVRPDGSVMRVDPESNGRTFSDTNCYFITRDAFKVFTHWGFKDPALGIIGDRYFFKGAQEYSMAHCRAPTVNYTAGSASYYIQAGETPPDDVKIVVKFMNDERAHTITWGQYQKNKDDLVVMEILDLVDEMRNGLFRERV